MVVPKCDSYILTPCDPEKLAKPPITLHPCQVHPRCKFSDRRFAGSRDTAHKYFLWSPKKRWKYVMVTYFSVCNQGSLVDQCMMTTSVCTAVTICATLFFPKFVVGQGDLVFGLRGLFTIMSVCSRFRSLCPAVTICDTI